MREGGENGGEGGEGGGWTRDHAVAAAWHGWSSAMWAHATAFTMNIGARCAAPPETPSAQHPGHSHKS